MNITKFQLKSAYKDKETVIRVLLILKLIELNIKLTEKNLDLLVLFAFSNNKKEVLKEALKKGIIQSIGSGENMVCLMGKKGIFEKNKAINSNFRKIKEEILPKIESELIAGIYKIHNLNVTT